MDRAAASGAAGAGSNPARRVFKYKENHAKTKDHHFSHWGQQYQFQS